MDILLPPRENGERENMTFDARQVIIVGANGAGKTRFADYLISGMENRSFRMSALQALYDTRANDELRGSIDDLYNKAFSDTDIIIDSRATSQFERLMRLLIHDEMLNLMTYKVNVASDPSIRLMPTRLDKVIALWQNVFPGNKALVENGKLLFTRKEDHKAYSSLRLSAGEKAVMYYAGAILYAMEGAAIFVDNPGMFLHPSIMHSVWNHLEELRPDCTFIYTTHDLDFASSRTDSAVIWVRDYDAEKVTWDYRVLPSHAGLSDDIYLTIIGARKPVLFIEGDETRSIDSKLYPLIFPQFTVKPLGSCNKVIEATRAFNDLVAFHQMDSYGIVDRDRRDAGEVQYLRRKKILVPDVAEIENLLMLENIVRVVAHRHGKDANQVFRKVKMSIIDQFRQDLRQQALLHTRHRVKRTVEHRIDGRFTNINSLEDHINDLVQEINPRGLYEAFCREFHKYVDAGDYKSILRVYNQKSMIASSNVAALCGVNRKGKDGYLQSIIYILKEDGKDAQRIRQAVINSFNIDDATFSSLKNEIQDE
ncbi:MAG: DUF4435 domain-containing protein [Muribaculaceae bacterium]|nr:DUF4435 domain-containing protein [Muribaculaceae bacterium]